MKEMEGINQLGEQPITQHPVIWRVKLFNEGSSWKEFHFHPFIPPNKNKLSFIFNWFHWIWWSEIQWSWLKIYYNSMLKVISWYKIILNLLMEWLMESINEIDFMNEMTFKPPASQSINSSFLSLWEWERKERIDLIEGVWRPQGNEWVKKWNGWTVSFAAAALSAPSLSSFFSSFLQLLKKWERKEKKRLANGAEWVCCSLLLEWIVGYERRAP